MDNKTMLALREAGVDTQGALRRFCENAALYERFLMKFPEDENFGRIRAALEAGDMEDALMAAHTLKGVSGNLGMDRLYRACADMVSLIRAGRHERTGQSFQELEQAYRQVCRALTGAEGE